LPRIVIARANAGAPGHAGNQVRDRPARQAQVFGTAATVADEAVPALIARLRPG
jgi:hypothetical protein